MNERDRLIAQLIIEKGGSRKDYLNLINRLEYHETGGTFDTQIEAGLVKGHSKKSGAVGILQYKKGKNEGGITAARRLDRYYKKLGIAPKKWLTNALKKDTLDVRSLTREQQETLFLGDMRGHPSANFSNVWEGKESVKDFWLKYHWAGKDKYKKARGDSFDSSMNAYNKEYKTHDPIYDIPTDTIRNMGSDRERPIEPEKPQQLEPQIPQSPQVDYSMQGFVKDLRQYAHGGAMGGNQYRDKEINMFDVDTTHEANPHGGIPIGSDATVEGDEGSYELKSGKFIFASKKRIEYEN